MAYWWKVRLYNTEGQYWHGQIATGDNLIEIEIIKAFYFTLTGCKMLLEGMSDRQYEDIVLIGKSFAGIWSSKP